MENVISLKYFRSQLLAEELIMKSIINSQFLNAMVANNPIFVPKSNNNYQSQFGNSCVHYSNFGNTGQFNGNSGGYKQYNNNWQKGKGKFHQGYRFPTPRQHNYYQAPTFPINASGVLGPSLPQSFGNPSA